MDNEDIYKYEKMLHQSPPAYDIQFDSCLSSSTHNHTSYSDDVFPPPQYTSAPPTYTHSVSIQPSSLAKRCRSSKRGSAPMHLLVSLVMMMICFVIGTPFSLLLTIPAYALADRAEVLIQRGEVVRARNLIRWSYALNGAVVVLGVCSIVGFSLLYVASVTHRFPPIPSTKNTHT